MSSGASRLAGGRRREHEFRGAGARLELHQRAGRRPLERLRPLPQQSTRTCTLHYSTVQYCTIEYNCSVSRSLPILIAAHASHAARVAHKTELVTDTLQ